MATWRYFWEVDNDRDFTDIEQARKWAQLDYSISQFPIVRSGRLLSELPAGAPYGLIDEALRGLFEHAPGEKDVIEWVSCVLAFRKLARRLKNQIGTHGASIGNKEADAILVRYVSFTSPRVVSREPVIRPQCPVIYVPLNDRGSQEVKNFRDAATLIWAAVFGSLWFDTPLGRCAECGVDMGLTTKTGKPKRGQFCKSCLDKQRYRRIKASPTARKSYNAESAANMREWRAKIREAHAMRTEGKSLKQIAEHFKTTTKVVKGWIEQKAQQQGGTK